MTEKTFRTKDTLFAAKENFGFFLLGLSPILGHGFSGLTQGMEKKWATRLVRLSGGNQQTGWCGCWR